MARALRRGLLLLGLGLTMSCLVPQMAHALAVRMCCVCSGCPQAATICALPPPGDTAPDAVAGDGGAAGPVPACDPVCAGCASVQLVDQRCADLQQCQQPVHAPATSHQVLVALGVLLAVYGVRTVQRARQRSRS